MRRDNSSGRCGADNDSKLAITVDSEHGAKTQVRMRLSAGRRWIRTLGPGATELRDHSAGLNCGRWDYIYSFIKKFAEDPAC